MSRVEPRPTITKVWARNFRSIKSAELELGDLTVLVGPNASGKSNLVDILRFLSDTARDGLAKAIERRGGIGTFGRKPPKGRALAPEIGLRMDTLEGVLDYGFALAHRGGGGYEVKREYASYAPTGYQGVPYSIEIVKGRLSEETFESLAGEGVSQEDLARIKTTSGVIAAYSSIEAADGQSLLLVPPERMGVAWALAGVYSPPSGNLADTPALVLREALWAMKNFLSSVALYRLFPDALRAPQVAAEGHPLAANGENLASALREMIRKKNGFLPNLKEALAVAIEGVRDFRVTQAGSHCVVEVKHESEPGSGRGRWIDLLNESDGTIRLLAMLTALYQQPSPALMCLEEPEMAIHPWTIAVLSEYIYEASMRGQVVLTTHRPELLDRFPVESIRAVSAENGSTRVGEIVESQLKSISKKLFLPGEVHAMEGLAPERVGK